MYRNYWSDNLDNRTTNHIQDELRVLIRQSITPIVNTVFNKITEEELENMILDILPKAMVMLLIDNLKGSFYSLQNDQMNLMETVIENHINSRLNR